MKPITPYPFQRDAVKEILKQSKEGNSIVVVAPQGAGKTVIEADLVREALKKKERMLIVAYRREPAEQILEHILAIGVSKSNVGMIMAGREFNVNAPVIIASWGTLIRRPYMANSTKDIKWLVLDECHHALSQSYMDVINNHYTANLVGFTATPYRMDKLGLGDIFDELYTAAQPSELIQQSMLANPRVFTTKEEFLPDIVNIKKAATGDYAPGELEKAVKKKGLVGDIVRNWKKNTSGRRTIAFGATVAHSKYIRDMFVRAGISASHVDSRMPLDLRKEKIEELRSGKTTVLCNCMILSEGFDLPSCQAIILARPTRSFTLAQQQAGRGMRYYTRERPIILDHARVCVAFGLPHSDREHKLTFTEVAINPSQGSIKVCPYCDAVVPSGCKECPECGSELLITMRIGIPGETVKDLDEISSKVITDIRTKATTFINKNSGNLSTTQRSQWVSKVMMHLGAEVY